MGHPHMKRLASGEDIDGQLELGDERTCATERDNRGTQEETPGPTPLSVTTLSPQEGSDCFRQ
jgi:hypothetical protein